MTFFLNLSHYLLNLITHFQVLKHYITQILKPLLNHPLPYPFDDSIPKQKHYLIIDQDIEILIFLQTYIPKETHFIILID